MSLLPSELLQVCSTSNNANGNKQAKQVIFFSGIAWYYGDNDFRFHCMFRRSVHDLYTVCDTDSREPATEVHCRIQQCDQTGIIFDLYIGL